MKSSDRRAPDLAKEVPELLDADLRGPIERGMRDRHHEHLPAGHGLLVDARIGDAGDDGSGEPLPHAAAALIIAVHGTERRAHEVFVFVRGEGALHTAIDYCDGLLAEILGTDGDPPQGPDDGHFLPLDFEGRPFEGRIIFVRGEIRDYRAEREAAALLQEAPPPRAIARGFDDVQ